jgi:adenosylcobinamide-phosphate synthase
MPPIGPVDPLVILLVALFVDAFAGEWGPVFRYIAHPVAAIGALIGALEKRLNREQRSAMDRRLRGLIVVLFVAALCAAIGWAILLATRAGRFGWLVELAVVALLLAQRSLFDHVLAVATGLESGVEGGRKAVARIVGRDPETLDAPGVARAALESLFENFADGVVAPAFWYVVAGLPGLMAYKAINTADSMLGHRSPRFADFGFAAAKIDTAANYLPARLSAAIICIAALFTPTARPGAALSAVIKDARRHRSLNAGWPEAAAAGALDLALAGPRRYGGVVVDDAWMGSGRARATHADIRRGLILFGVACLVHIVLIALLALLRLW